MPSRAPKVEVDQFGNPIQSSSQSQASSSSSSQRPPPTIKMSSMLDKSKAQQRPQATVKMPSTLDKSLRPQTQVMPSKLDKLQYAPSSSKQQSVAPSPPISIRPPPASLKQQSYAPPAPVQSKQPSFAQYSQQQQSVAPAAPSSSKQQTYVPPPPSSSAYPSQPPPSYASKQQSYAPIAPSSSFIASVAPPPPISSKMASVAPPPAPSKAQTMFKSQYDVEMAQKQTRIETLTAQERQQQEEWAQNQLNDNASAGACVMGFAWYRQDVKVNGKMTGGYRCHGGSHFVSDVLLAAGQGGYYTRPNVEQMLDKITADIGMPGRLPPGVEQLEVVWVGPFYGDPVSMHMEAIITLDQHHAWYDDLIEQLLMWGARLVRGRLVPPRHFPSGGHHGGHHHHQHHGGPHGGPFGGGGGGYILHAVPKRPFGH